MMKRLLFACMAILLSCDSYAATSPKVSFGNNQPTTCNPANGDFWIDTNGTAGNRLYICTATNTYTLNDGLAGTKADASCFASESAFNACFALDWQAVNASGFDGNLATTDDTLQEIAQKVDDLVLGSGSGSMTWPSSDGNYYGARNGAWTSLGSVFAAALRSDDNYVTDAEKTKISNLSGTNTGDQDLSPYISKTNTTSFTPSADYHPATKKYVDDSITAGGGYTDEQAQDAVGGMFAGNTETGITITYDDATAKINATVTTQFDGSQNTSGSAGSIGGVVTASGITGALNLTKTGTTARTVTFPDAAGTVALTSDIVAAPTDATITTTDVTTNNASTTKHGWVPKATAPASGLRNLVAIDNGETVYTNKALFDATSPSTQASGDSAVVGTAMTAARRDHKHAMPTIPTAASLSVDDLITLSGVATGAVNLGTFTGATIADSSTVKTALQAVETEVETKADATNISFIASALSDMKILDTAQPVNGSVWVDDMLAYNAPDDHLHLWSISKIGGELAGKQASDTDLTSASGASAAGVSKYWGTNASSVVGFYDLPSGGGTPTTITVADTTDTTSFVALFTDAAGDLGPKTDAGLTYNAGTGMLTATGFTGPLTGTASGNTRTIASGAYTVDTTSIPANSCATAVAVTATNTATTDTIVANPNAILSSIAGFGVTSAGAVRVDIYPTANNVNFQFCNPTGTDIDPGSVTFNWKVLR